MILFKLCNLLNNLSQHVYSLFFFFLSQLATLKAIENNTLDHVHISLFLSYTWF